ncbi:hypothetical protein MSPP1_003267 [Malassezia sp. CBS 17886]|nr:hypothetical protein MSPP1_003267 [Malassezia sp. CBS 17886]
MDQQWTWAEAYGGSNGHPAMPPPPAPPPGEATPHLRLVKVASDALPSAKCVAVVDGRHGGVSVGRDRTFTRRVRLPSMEISKHHANLFSSARQPHAFSVTDTGSTHGTFVCRRPTCSPISRAQYARLADASFERLSPAKHASRPFLLEHLDLVRFGANGSTFEVHLHGTAWGCCAACQVRQDGTNEISVEPQGAKPRGEQRHAAAPTRKHQEMDRRKRMKKLRDVYLSEGNEQGEGGDARAHAGESAKCRYRDRAAARRTRHPGVAVPTPASAPPSREPAHAQLAPAHPAPLSAGNVGFQMLAKMSGESTPSMPSSEAAFLPPVAAGRAGLGSQVLRDAGEHAAAVAVQQAAPGKEKRR